MSYKELKQWFHRHVFSSQGEELTNFSRQIEIYDSPEPATQIRTPGFCLRSSLFGSLNQFCPILYRLLGIILPA
jgi:hypothetical protein